MTRVVVVDAGDDSQALRAALADHPEVAVDVAAELPRGDDVLALVVPPEVRVGAAELEALPRVRIVAALSTGFEQLDVEQIAAAGAWPTRCPSYCEEEVAEHAIAFALDLLRGVTMLDREVREGRWELGGAEPRRVAGAVMGIVGLGQIGRQVAWRASALGMRVLAHDPLVDSAEVELVSLDELLQTADVVTLHAPVMASTRGVIGARELGLMRPGAFLINCARAALVDHDALGEALRAGTLGGCALDVLPDEPPGSDEPALSWPRSLINPHAAWYSPQSADAPYRLCGEAIAAVLDGREPPGALARPLGRARDQGG